MKRRALFAKIATIAAAVAVAPLAETAQARTHEVMGTTTYGDFVQLPPTVTEPLVLYSSTWNVVPPLDTVKHMGLTIADGAEESGAWRTGIYFSPPTFEAMHADIAADAYNRGHAVATARAESRVALGLPLERLG